MSERWWQVMLTIGLTLLVGVLLLGGTLSAAPILAGERMHPVLGQSGMVVTSHPLATAAGLTVLKNGGNAIDAAVTVGFVLAVVQPRSGNLGGGGFMLISSEAKNEVVAVDYRETAPGRATTDMFLDPQGELDKQAARYSHRAAGVPGSVAGLALALETYGTISLAQVLAPAIQLAKEGFVVTPRFSAGLMEAAERLKRWETTRKIFYKPDGGFYQPGERFVQPELAATLQRIAAHGAREFYQGKTAELLVAEMQRHGGLINRADLRAYRPVLRRPVRGNYRGFEIYSMPPPSSGGVHVVEILNILEGYSIGASGHNAARNIHLLAEAMKRAYADRSHYLGDADFVDVPLRALTSKTYAAALRKAINPDQATPSATITPGKLAPYESGQTTHFSVVDRFGNAVANTTTINFSYGSGIVVAGAGFLLNNEMDDFSAKTGVPNAYGLLGGEANKIEPGKRMLSSMAPTIVRQDGKNYLVTGSPGGSRIITTVLQVIMNVIDHGLNIQSAVAAPRVHHQWLPDELRIEEGISPDTVRLLEGMGHTVRRQSAMGASQSILIRDGVMYGGADPRRSTSLAAGF
jgi:gamma-glutamyltranspeptidase / glutathione hydrolase